METGFKRRERGQYWHVSAVKSAQIRVLTTCGLSLTLDCMGIMSRIRKSAMMCKQLYPSKCVLIVFVLSEAGSVISVPPFLPSIISRWAQQSYSLVDAGVNGVVLLRTLCFLQHALFLLCTTFPSPPRKRFKTKNVKCQELNP